MSTLELTALTLVSIWLAVLSIAVLITVRQVGILTVRLDLTRDQLEPAVDGLAVGAPVPNDALAKLPRLREGSNYILALSGTCDPCREFVAELVGHDLPRPVIALVAGPAGRAGPLISLVPPTIHVIRDPSASALLRLLQIHTTPFAVAIEAGAVSGYAQSTSPADLLKLMEAREPNVRRPARSVETVPEVSVNDRTA